MEDHEAPDPSQKTQKTKQVKKTLTPEQRKLRQKRAAHILASIVATALLAVMAVYAFAYATSPAAIRNPQFQHYHFRTQIIVSGRAVNFAEPAFQESYSKDSCNVNLTSTPVHFHDRKDQITHIHWDGLTGGQVLKYYGWNLIGGPSTVLGYRFDRLPQVGKVPIHGQVLPRIPQGTSFYVYTGDENNYKARHWNDFLTQDLEDFFGKKSNIGEPEETSLLDKLFPRAYAHAGHDHSAPPTETELKEINNLLGNVVIFVQKDQPSPEQVKDRFSRLEPLTASTCGG